MGLIDFKEIAQANISNGEQDEFELFARDFFILLGFSIEEGPDRGPDGGRDLIICEERVGKIANSKIRWLVSCKHKAHSGTSVLESEEVDIPGRIEQFKCNGFIGFYSTIPSSGLSRKIKQYEERFEICIFDSAMIEKTLLDNLDAEMILRRYFPKSYMNGINNVGPSMIYSQYNPLKCEACGKDLLQKNIIADYQGIVVLVREFENENIDNDGKITKVYCVCKGKCDIKMESKYRTNKTVTEWQDISDLIIPFEYLNWVMGILNDIKYQKMAISDQAYEEIKDITLRIAQLAMRQPSLREMKRVKELCALDPGL